MKWNVLVLGLGAALLGACSTPSEAEDPGRTPSDSAASAGPAELAGPVEPLPWTEEFQAEAMLVAAEVQIVGPPGLRDHFAVAQDAVHHTYTIETVPQGLLQETLVREASIGEVPVRCHLDNLTIVVERRVVVLERPGAVPVTVTAHGDVFWRNAATGEELRAAALTLTGEAPR